MKTPLERLNLATNRNYSLKVTDRYRVWYRLDLDGMAIGPPLQKNGMDDLLSAIAEIAECAGEYGRMYKPVALPAESKPRERPVSVEIVQESKKVIKDAIGIAPHLQDAYQTALKSLDDMEARLKKQTEIRPDKQ